MENNLNILLNCDTFDYNVLLQKYNEEETESDFNLNDFKIFIEKFNKEAKEFEEKTGVPKKHFISKLNLSIFERKCTIGYCEVKDIYIFFDDDDNAIFLRDKKRISIVKKNKQKGNWLISKLDKLTIEYKNENRNIEIDKVLYLSDKFNVHKVNSFFIRSYLDCLYDIVVKFNGKYLLFFSVDNIDEYSLILTGNEDLPKIRRMIKLNKLEIKNILK